MANEKHPFDVAAERLEAIADTPVAGQDASPEYWELKSATDETTGDYPQAQLPEEHDWGESYGLGDDGFPTEPIPNQQLVETGLWTDVLSSSLWSEGRLFNPKAHSVFRRMNLGKFREYPTNVADLNGEMHPLVYFHFQNEVEPTAIDFETSEFYIAEMLSMPGPSVSIRSFEDWSEKIGQAREGKLNGCEQFSRIEFKQLFFKRGCSPNVDIFSLGRLSARVYITTKLRDAIVESGITGLEIKENKRLFAQ